MIIDFHAHIYPDKIAEKASEAIGKFYEAPMHCLGSTAELLENGAKIGVTKYVVHSAATTDKQVESINNFIIGETKKHPEFIGFGTIHPDYKNYKDELNRIKNEGLRGIKIHPDFQKFKVDADEMDAIYDEMADLKLILLLHAGDARFDFSGPQRIAHLIEKHPALTVVAAHFGGYTEWGKAQEYLVGKNCYFDTSSTLWKLDYKTALEMIRAHGPEKFLFGSDYPMWKHDDEFERFNKLGLTEHEKELILYKNAANLLGLSETK